MFSRRIQPQCLQSMPQMLSLGADSGAGGLLAPIVSRVQWWLLKTNRICTRNKSRHLTGFRSAPRVYLNTMASHCIEF